MSAPDETADRIREHEFDGIQEYDNRLPNWWLWTFWGACVFALAYWVHFHVLGTGKLPHEKYRLELEAREAAVAAARVTVDDADLLAAAADPDIVARGRETFAQMCTACHGPDGGAAGPAFIGPNLTDDHWLHGGAPSQVFRTIFDGVPDKGMVAWGPTLGREKVEQVTAYVLTLRGKPVEGGKAPQGELYQGQ